MDLIALYQKLTSSGSMVGWIVLIVVGLYLYNQFKSGKLNLTDLWTKFLTLLNVRPTNAQIQSIVEDHVESILPPVNPSTAAFEAVQTLTDYFKNDADGLAAAIKCGERLIHVTTPASASK